MPLMLDTSVAILLRDGDVPTVNRLMGINDKLVMSVVSRVELEGGVHRVPADAALVRRRLDRLYQDVQSLDFDTACANTYGRIVAAAGYSRRKILDRMIAAQVLVSGATLATTNPQDFSDVPGLKIEAW
jgi:tRNA(fMet)-specific endonuclease VapC